MDKFVIFIDYNNKRLFLTSDKHLSFTADINYARVFNCELYVKKMCRKLFYSGYECDIIRYRDIYDIFHVERLANGLLSSDGRCCKRN